MDPQTRDAPSHRTQRAGSLLVAPQKGVDLNRPTICVVLVALLLCHAETVDAQSRTDVSAETFAEWMSELSNWGRWGQHDELGTVNLITAKKRVSAAQLVKTGISVSLARDLDKSASLHNVSPLRHEMNFTGLEPGGGQFSGDSYWIRYHGLAHSHLDALGHVFYNGKMYNGFAQGLVTDAGAQKLSINTLAHGIFSRGVLIDVPWTKGVPYLEPGTAILEEDLDAWEAKSGVRLSPGDVVLIRTGRWARLEDKGPWAVGEALAGVHASAVKWLRNRDVAVVGTDAGVDVIPSGVEGQPFPVHRLLIVAMGTPVFDNLDLEQLSEEAIRQKRWDFLLTVAPLRVQGGTGSPLNPIATF